MGAIYVITNMQNGKKYVGQTLRDPEARRQAHIRSLKKNCHENQYLQNTFNKYGNIFSFEIVCEKSNIDELNEAECQYIEKWDTRNREYGYNIRHGGRNGKASPESRKKMSEVKKGVARDKMARKNIATKNVGGFLGFRGGFYNHKNINPWNKVWASRISYKGHRKNLGSFHDPLSAQIVYDFVFKEIYPFE